MVLQLNVLNVNTVFAFSGGPPDGRTGSPADSLLTCNDTGCHNNYALNSGSAAFSISAPSSYTLGETLSISISFSNSSTAKHGFELSALDTNNNHVGIFSSVDGDDNTQTSNGDYIKHTSAGSSQSGNASWNVQWTAPTSEVQNPVTFYAAGNEANGDGTNQGDYIYTITAQSSMFATTPTTTPTATPSTIPVATPTPTLTLSEGIRTLHGYVKDTDENTVPGATVAITAAYSFKNIVASTTTDEDGYYAFENETVDYDGYIIISKDNYYTSYCLGYLVDDEDTLDLYIEKNHGVIIMSGVWGGWFLTNHFEWHGVELKVKQNGKKINGKWRSSSSGVGGKFWGTLDGVEKKTIYRWLQGQISWNCHCWRGR